MLRHIIEGDTVYSLIYGEGVVITQTKDIMYVRSFDPVSVMPYDYQGYLLTPNSCMPILYESKPRINIQEEKYFHLNGHDIPDLRRVPEEGRKYYVPCYHQGAAPIVFSGEPEVGLYYFPFNTFGKEAALLTNKALFDEIPF